MGSSGCFAELGGKTYFGILWRSFALGETWDKFAHVFVVFYTNEIMGEGSGDLRSFWEVERKSFGLAFS